MKVGWKAVSGQEYEDAISSATTTRLPQEQWPDFVGGIAGVRDVYGVGFTEPRDIASDDTLVREATGSIDVVGKDGDLFKSYRFLYVAGGAEFFRAGPVRDLDYRHHREDPPDL